MSTWSQTSRRGFTLVEAVATMTILAVVSMAASRIIFAATDAYASDAVRSELVQDLSSAMERITSELRSIPSRNASPGTPWIDSIAGGLIEFGTGSQLALDGESLELAVDGGPARMLVDHVTSFTIACFDESGQALTLPLSGAACDVIRRMEVQITKSRHGTSETLRTRVFLRCAMAGGAGGAGGGT